MDTRGKIRFTLLSVILLYSLLVNSQTIPGTPFLGYTKGYASVTEGGSATYSIPLLNPSGTGGIQPKLSLNYSSHTGNGIFGLGFSMSGFSVISAVNQTRLLNERYSSETSRLSLDGQKLVLAPESIDTTLFYDANYGKAGTVYHTEKQSFVKIVAFERTTDDKIKFFKAYTKSGEIVEYGNTEDSRIYLPGSTKPMYWLVNRIEDRNGNYMIFQYTKNNLTGEFFPDKILYTGNSNTNLAPYNKVQFFYSSRNDSTTHYLASKKITNNTKKVDKIVCYSDNIPVRSYEIQYQQYVQTNTYRLRYSLIEKIKECDGNGNCLPPTVLTWEMPVVQSMTNSAFISKKSISDTKFKKSNTTQQIFIDFDGDGDIDFLYYNITTGENTVYLIDRSFTPSDLNNVLQNPISPALIKEGYLRTLDINLDGTNDLIWNNPFTGASRFFLTEIANNKIIFKEPISVTLPTTGSSPFGIDKEIILKDIDSDGRTDFVFYSRDNNGAIVDLNPTIWLNKSTTNVTSNSSKQYIVEFKLKIDDSGQVSNRSKKYHIEDFDNDGIADIMSISANHGVDLAIQSPSATQEVLINQTFYKRQRKYPFQYNYWFFSNGYIQPGYTLNPDGTYILDVNGDHLPEIVHFYGNGFDIFINTGESYTVPAEKKGYSNSIMTSHPNLHLTDIDGDGLVDFCFYNKTTGENYTYLNRGNFKVFYDDPNDPPYLNVLPVEIFKEQNQWIPTGTKQTSVLGPNGQPFNSFLWYDKNTGVGEQIFTPIQYINGITLTNITEGELIKYSFKTGTLFGSSYKKTSSIKKFPYTELIGPIKFTTEFKTYSLLNNSSEKLEQTYSFKYEGAMVNTLDRGFFGFQKVTKIDEQAGIESISYHVFDSLGINYLTNTLAKTETRFKNNGAIISESFLEKKLLKYPNYSSSVTGFGYDTRNRSFLDYNGKSTHKNYELGGALESTNINTQIMDYYGNVTNAVMNYGNGFKDSTVSRYTNNSTDWILGRIDYAKVYRFAPQQPTVIRSSAFIYDNKGRLVKEISDPDSNARLQVVKQYYYDNYGNITKSELTAWNGSVFETRSTQSVYDSKGRFIVKSVNSLGHETNYQYDSKLGLVTSITDPNGTTINYQYDSFGRKTKDIGADGNWISVDLRKANENTSVFGSPRDAAYVKYIQSSLDPPIIEHYDAFDRLLLKEITGFDGKKVYSKVEYDIKGQVKRESLPFYSGATIYWNESKYDTLGRVIQSIAPGNRISTATYAVKQSTSINPLGQKAIIYKNTKDQIVKVIDNANQTLDFTYDGIGQLLKTADPKGNNTSNQYDFRGFRIKAFDPNSGTFQYFYNGFGELIKQINSRGQETTIEYDKLGRIIKKTQPEGITTWVYDIGNKAIGKISSTNSPVESINYTYDNLGRVINERQVIQGRIYTRAFVFDANGRLKDINYLSGKLLIRQIYNQYNFISEVRNITGGLNQLLWQLSKTNALGQIEKQIYGNGLSINQEVDPEKNTINKITTLRANNQIASELGFSYDAIGRLLERKHITKNKREVFTYDNLNRLTKTEVVGGYAVDITYDILGNITYKSDVGTYIYGSVNNGPHRLIRVDLNNSGACVPSLFANAEYNSFNKASTIYSDTAKIDILYDAGQQRVLQNLYVNNSWQRMRTYVGNYAQIDSSTKNVETSIYIGTPVGIIGTYVITRINNTTQSNFVYWHKDHLGSVVGISDNNSTLTEFSYDAWGQRRNEDWSALTGSPNGYFRGFTGHEHYDMFGLIDMNGRIYDPVLARFLSPDPIIQAQADLQNYNRYTYVFNNPLSYTDPNGYGGIGDFLDDVFGGTGDFIQDTFDGIVDTTEEIFEFTNKYNGIDWAIKNRELVITLAANYFLPPGVGAFTATMVNSLMAGNSFSDALKASAKSFVIASISAGLTDLVGDAAQISGTYFKPGMASSMTSYAVSVVGHGIVQGAMEVADGGKFMHGFNAGAFTAAISPVYQGWTDEARVFASAMVGGTAARMSGGSFTNGAVSGAFIQMFNHDGDHSDVSGESTLDKIQTGLDYAGFINPLADIANAGIYALRGDFGMAGLNLVAAIPMVGDGIKAAYKVEKFSSKLSQKAYKQSYKYDDRVLKRSLEDPKSHNFPYSFDSHILSTKPIPQKNGYNYYRLDGKMNSNKGVYEIGVTKDGTINHRVFKSN